LSFEDAIQQLVIDRLFEECAKSWGLVRGSVISVAVTLNYLSLTASSADELASPEQQLECETLCRTFMTRFKGRTAAYGTIRTIYRQGDTGEGYGFLFVLKPPTGIERLILEKIINDCWEHCSDRITSFAIEEEDGRFAASVEFATTAR
jgi:hypothetical protein